MNVESRVAALAQLDESTYAGAPRSLLQRRHAADRPAARPAQSAHARMLAKQRV
jgi:hypothetical protein